MMSAVVLIGTASIAPAGVRRRLLNVVAVVKPGSDYSACMLLPGRLRP